MPSSNPEIDSSDITASLWIAGGAQFSQYKGRKGGDKNETSQLLPAHGNSENAGTFLNPLNNVSFKPWFAHFKHNSELWYV